jgi:hypothetical protein
MQKVIEPEPLIGWRQVNIHWKAGEVLYLFSIRLPAKFQIEQQQIFNLLTITHSKVLINFVIRFFMFGGYAAGLSIAICYRASKIYALTHNLVTIIKSFCDGSLSELRFRTRFRTKWPFWQFSSPFELRMRIVNSTWHNLMVVEDYRIITLKPFK